MTIDVLKALPNDTKRNSMLPSLSRPRTSVRRSLFGEVDHEESMAFLQKELDSITNTQKERWNFDFMKETPINSADGAYEWLQVQPDDKIPKAYALSRLPFLSSNSDLPESTNNNLECSSDDDGVCDVINTNTNISTSTTEHRLKDTDAIRDDDNLVTVRNTQKSMTDYLKTKKRSLQSIPQQKSQKDDCPYLDSTSSQVESEECHNSYLISSSKRMRFSSQ